MGIPYKNTVWESAHDLETLLYKCSIAESKITFSLAVWFILYSMGSSLWSTVSWTCFLEQFPADLPSSPTSQGSSAAFSFIIHNNLEIHGSLITESVFSLWDPFTHSDNWERLCKEAPPFRRWDQFSIDLPDPLYGITFSETHLSTSRMVPKTFLFSQTFLDL